MRSHYPEQDSNIQEKGEVIQALTTKPCPHRNSQGVAVWWHTTVRPALGGLRQWNRCEFEASLGWCESLFLKQKCSPTPLFGDLFPIQGLPRPPAAAFHIPPPPEAAQPFPGESAPCACSGGWRPTVY